MSIKRFYACKKLLVVAKGNEDLCMVPHGLLQDGEWALADFVFLKLAQLGLIQLRFWDMHVLTMESKMV